MPYTHPDLGVPCMTVTEFWQAEAAKENRDVGDLIGDFYTEIANDEKSAVQEIHNNPDVALTMLKDYYSADPECSTFQPIQIIDLIDVKVAYGMSRSTTSFTAIVICDDGVTRKLAYTETHYAGSYMDPPDFDYNCVEV